MLNFDYSIDHLKKLANNSDIHNKHAAGVIYNNKLISSGINKFISFKTYGRTMHAEISAFSNLSKNIKIKGLDIIVIRIKNGHDTTVLKNSRPCSICITKLQKYGVRKVYYSNEHGIIVNEFVSDMEKTHTSSNNRRL